MRARRSGISCAPLRNSDRLTLTSCIPRQLRDALGLALGARLQASTDRNGRLLLEPSKYEPEDLFRDRPRVHRVMTPIAEQASSAGGLPVLSFVRLFSDSEGVEPLSQTGIPSMVLSRHRYARPPTGSRGCPFSLRAKTKAFSAGISRILLTGLPRRPKNSTSQGVEPSF